MRSNASLWVPAVAGLVVVAACGGASKSHGTPARIDRQTDPVSAVADAPPWSDEDYRGPGHACFRHSPSTEVDLDPTSDAVLQYSPESSVAAGFHTIASSPWGPSLRRVVLADHARGVRVVLLNEAGREAHVTPSLPLPVQPLELRVFGDRALLTTSTAEGYELHWLALHEDREPELLARLPQKGALRGAHALPSGRGLALIADVDGEGMCAERASTKLRVLALHDDRIELQQELDFGAGVMRVLRSGSALLVQDQQPTPSGDLAYGVRLVELDAKVLAPTARRVSGSMPLAFHAQGSRIDLVSVSHSHAGRAPQATVTARFSIEQLKLTRDQLQVAKVCAYESTAAPVNDYQMAEPQRFTQAIFLRDRVLLALSDGLTERVSVRDFRRSTCAMSDSPVQGARFMLTPKQDALIGLTPAEGKTLDVYVHDLAKLSGPAANARDALDKPELRADSVLPSTSHYYWVHSARWHTVGKKLLLSVPFQEHGRGGRYRDGTQLFEIDRASVRARAPLDTRLWLTRADGTALGSYDGGLALETIAETEPSTPAAGVRRDLWTRHLDAQVLIHNRPDDVPRGIARIRYPHPSGAYDPHTDALLAQLEFVPGDRDPQTGAPSAAFPISGNARLDAVDWTLIASSQEIARSENKPTRPCRFDVFDTSTLEGITKPVTLVSNELCSEQRALSDYTVLTAGHGLVFAWTERQYDGPHEIVGQRLAFYVLDVHDPKAPFFRGPYHTPAAEYTLGAFNEGDGVVLYAFRLPAASSNPKQPLAHFYARRINFLHASGPIFEEPFSIRGEPFAIRGVQLFTREAQWRGDTAEHSLHLLVLRQHGFEEGPAPASQLDVFQLERRAPGVEEDDIIVDLSGDDMLVIKQGVIRRLPRSFD